MADDAGKQESSSLEEFSKRLDAVRGASSSKESAESGRNAAMGKGFRLASELLAAMIVGPVLGLGIDKLAGTAPWGLLLGIFVGFAAGVKNVAAAMKDNSADETAQD
ncbi:MAG: AtpZ/AtpI family protein [Parvularculaceae bacterium]